jgi:type 1 fimbria pilin
MHKKSKSGLSNLLFLFALLPLMMLPKAWAQAAGTASVQGTVTDPTACPTFPLVPIR